MIFDFPIDPFHLVYLGVVKRYLKILSFGTRLDKRNRLPMSTRRQPNNMLSSFSKMYPKEFHSKRRAIAKLSFWKTVEYRSYLLFIRPFVLTCLSKEKYEHFL